MGHGTPPKPRLRIAHLELNVDGQAGWLEVLLYVALNHAGDMTHLLLLNIGN